MARTATIFGLLAVVLGGLAAAVWLGLGRPGAEPIVVGILHSQTGILAALEKNDYRAFTLLVEVVKSEPFQMRTATGGKQ